MYKYFEDFEQKHLEDPENIVLDTFNGPSRNDLALRGLPKKPASIAKRIWSTFGTSDLIRIQNIIY